jgi:hypothetical protein
MRHHFLELQGNFPPPGDVLTCNVRNLPGFLFDEGRSLTPGRTSSWSRLTEERGTYFTQGDGQGHQKRVNGIKCTYQEIIIVSSFRGKNNTRLGYRLKFMFT